MTAHTLPMAPSRTHGGTDAQGAPPLDFSTNSNACGPCPQALRAVNLADASRYPDGTYTDLILALARLHSVEPWRIVLAGSASEFIFRLTALAFKTGMRRVGLPAPAYGDYAYAADAWGLQKAVSPDHAELLWLCDPASPTGQTAHLVPAAPAMHTGFAALDCAYAPMRLVGSAAFDRAQRDLWWALFSPNKSLGLTGVRAAYAIAPVNAQIQAQTLEAMAPSWPVGAHGVAMLTAWSTPEVQAWLQGTLPTLAQYKRHLQQGLQTLGWELLPSDTHYFCARPPHPLSPQDVAHLRVQGIKLRDTTSMGLPGWYRLSAQPAEACAALLGALTAVQNQGPLARKELTS